jgi:hypothetical protein
MQSVAIEHGPSRDPIASLLCITIVWPTQAE